MSNNRQFDNLGDFISAVAGMAMTRAFAGIDAVDPGKFGDKFRVDCNTGVPVSDLDLDGADIRDVAVLGPDDVEIVFGENLAIIVEGDEDSADSVRFRLDDGRLAISRIGGTRQRGTAMVKIAMPKLRKLSLAGSGSIRCDAIKGEKGKISIAGSGSVTCDEIDVEQLKIQMMGSGSISGKGKADRLSLKIAGSGNVGLNGVRVQNAKISMAGSGNASFASDGEVTASMAGSGNITVKGRARCSVKGMGSGRLVCEPA